MQNTNSETIYRTNPLEVLVLPMARNGVEADRGQNREVGAEPGGVPLTQYGNSLGLDTSKPILCRTFRQALQLEELMNQELFPECEMELMEGELEAILRELDGGAAGAESDYCGLICNAFELSALGLEHRIRAIFTQEEMVPAAGMGFEQCVELGGEEIADRQTGLCGEDAENDAKSGGFAEIELRAELAFMDRIAELDGCATAGDMDDGETAEGKTIAMITSVYAEADQGGLELWALYYDEESGQWWTDWIAGDPESPEAVAAAFADQIRGGGQWIDEEE